MTRIVLASNNSHKIKEFAKILDKENIVKNKNTVNQAVASQNSPSRIVFNKSLSIT